MQLILEDKQRRTIKEKEEIRFSSFSSFHLIAITARAKSEKQISKDATDDEELIVKIDEKVFPKIGSKEALLDSPAAFNGGQLHNLAKTVYFLTFLKGRDHTIVLETDKPPYDTATLEELEINTLDLDSIFSLNINRQAEDGDRRPWLTLALDSLPLRAVIPTIAYSRRKRDSDDVKIVVDGKTQGNLLRNIRHFLWRYAGSLIPTFSSKTEIETFIVNHPQGLHYLEFYADRMPVLHKVILNFGTKPQPPVRIPTVDDPRWTGDFYDDTPQIILARAIFGEAEGASKQAKIAVGWTIKNRVLAQRREEWGLSYHEIILKPGQYEAFMRKDRLAKLKNPLTTDDEEVKEAWFNSYGIAGKVIKGTVADPTAGATNFYSTPIKTIPWWATSDREKGTIDNLHFYKL